MSHPAPPTPLWVEHLGQIAAAVGVAWGVLHGAWAVAARWLRRRERKRELEAARDEALRVLLDGAREALRDDGRADELEIRERVARRRTLLDRARDRFWLARGKKRSAPSSAEDEEEDSEE